VAITFEDNRGKRFLEARKASEAWRMAYFNYGHLLVDLREEGFSSAACKFSRHIYLIDGLPDIVEAVTGLRFITEELIRVGVVANWIKKLINLGAEFSRKDDALPPRTYLDEMSEGPSKGRRVKSGDLEKMPSDYYGARGWSKEGMPKKEQMRGAEAMRSKI